MSTGRKKIYNPEILEVGGRLELKGAAARYPDQYAKQFRSRNKDKYFRKKIEGDQVFIERIS